MARKNNIKKTGKSPYARYGKIPFRYSEVYYAWERAVKEGRNAEARRHSRDHALRFLGIDPTERPEFRPRQAA